MTTYDAQYTDYQLRRSWLRKMVRKAYLARAAAQLHGPTLDFGCGVGELLARLPAGSRGLEYNEATVAHCRAQGLAVEHYDGFADDWSLSPLSPADGLRSMVVSHVLEHLEDPGTIQRKLLAAAARLGIDTVLVIVPGRAGFRSDPTHVVFVDLAHVRANVPAGWTIEDDFYFPLPFESGGDVFVYNELHVRLRRQG